MWVNNIAKETSPLPSPLFNVEVGKWPLSGKRFGGVNNTELGGGGLANSVDCYLHIHCTKASKLNFLNSSVQDCSPESLCLERK